MEARQRVMEIIGGGGAIPTIPSILVRKSAVWHKNTGPINGDRQRLVIARHNIVSPPEKFEHSKMGLFFIKRQKNSHPQTNTQKQNASE